VVDKTAILHRELDELQDQSAHWREPSKRSPTMGLARGPLRSRNEGRLAASLSGGERLPVEPGLEIQSQIEREVNRDWQELS